MIRKQNLLALSAAAIFAGFGLHQANAGVPTNTNITILNPTLQFYGPNSSSGSYATLNGVASTSGSPETGYYGFPGTAGAKTGTTSGGQSATDTSGLGLTTVYYYNGADTPATITYNNPSGSGTYSVSGFNNAYLPAWSGPGGAIGAGNYAPVYDNGGLFGQVLSTAVQPDTTYLLTAYVHSTSQGTPPPILELTAGSSGTYSANPALQGGMYYGSPAASGQPGTAVSEVVTTGSNVSGNLGVVLGSTGLANVFSNVTLVANPTTLPTGNAYTQPAYITNGMAVTNAGPFAPTAGAADQQNLSPTGTVTTAYPNNPAGNTSPAINYYTNNSALPGQTFTTGSNAAGYKLNAITVNVADAGGGTFNDGNSLTLDIASISGTNFSLMEVVTGTVVTGSSIASGNFVTFALSSPINLKSNSIYGFAISGASSYAGLAVDTNAADYTGGQLAEFNLTGGFGGSLITNTAVPQSVFDVALTPATATPEPATLALLAAGGLAVLLRRRQRA